MSVRKTYLAILSIFAIRGRIHPPAHGRKERFEIDQLNASQKQKITRPPKIVSKGCV
jgi:hypothetical protein